MVRRTKKEFVDYNEFHDRPFPLKWGTAYALDDLMKHVRASEEYALKENPSKHQMTRSQIDIALSDAYLKHKEIDIQLNLIDEFSRLVDSISGFFSGEAYQDYFVINEQRIYWEDVRHVEILEFKKWSDNSMFDQKKKISPTNKPRDDPEIILEKDENFYQPFYDEEGEAHESE